MPYRTTVGLLARSRCQRPLRASTPGTTRTSAAIPTRAATAEPAVHPESSRPRASAPESPKVVADTTANASPLTVRELLS